jgi:hypothetical protein
MRLTTRVDPGRAPALLGLAAGALMVMGVATGMARPAGAAGDGPGLRSLCEQVAQDPPEGGARLTTDPPQGAPLRAGQTVSVTLRWDQAAFAGQDLRRAAHCVVTVDGRLRLELSGVEAPSANDGVYRASFTVPADLAPGECLCILGIASGDGPDGRPLRLGDGPCITVTAPPRTPSTTPPTTPPTGPPATPEAKPPLPTSVLPATLTAPPTLVPAAEKRPQPLAELPRTGPFDVRVLLAVAGLALVVGGGAVTARR